MCHLVQVRHQKTWINKSHRKILFQILHLAAINISNSMAPQIRFKSPKLCRTESRTLYYSRTQLSLSETGSCRLQRSWNRTWMILLISRSPKITWCSPYQDCKISRLSHTSNCQWSFPPWIIRKISLLQNKTRLHLWSFLSINSWMEPLHLKTWMSSRQRVACKTWAGLRSIQIRNRLNTLEGSMRLFMMISQLKFPRLLRRIICLIQP